MCASEMTVVCVSSRKISVCDLGVDGDVLFGRAQFHEIRKMLEAYSVHSRDFAWMKRLQQPCMCNTTHSTRSEYPFESQAHTHTKQKYVQSQYLFWGLSVCTHRIHCSFISYHWIISEIFRIIKIVKSLLRKVGVNNTMRYFVTQIN